MTFLFQDGLRGRVDRPEDSGKPPRGRLVPSRLEPCHPKTVSILPSTCTQNTCGRRAQRTGPQGGLTRLEPTHHRLAQLGRENKERRKKREKHQKAIADLLRTLLLRPARQAAFGQQSGLLPAPSLPQKLPASPWTARQLQPRPPREIERWSGREREKRPGI